VDRDAERRAFAWACDKLGYRAGAKWLAYVCATATGLLYIALLTVLTLFADLMVYRGQIPTYRELTPADEERLRQCWIDQQPEVRNEAEWNRRPQQEREAFWDEHVQGILYHRISDEAKGNYNERKQDSHHGHGIFALVVRADLQGRFWTPIIGWLARWNSWSWYSTTDSEILSPYLIGLTLLALILLLLRIGLKVLMQEAAAQASLEAAVWLRRAVYAQSFRLGTLAIRAMGPSEAVTIFTRHVEAVHDALFTRLTVMYREPLKFGLLLLFAILVDWKLALACVLCALIVWAIGGQILVYFQRRARETTNRASERLTLIRESLMMMRLVKVYLMEVFNQRRVERQLSKYAEAQLLAYRREALARPMLLVLGAIAGLLLLYFAGIIVLWGQVGVASLIAMTTSLISLYWPLQSWLAQKKKMRRGREAALQIQRFIERKSEVSQVVGAEFLPAIDKRIEFDNVTLREPGSGRLLLQNVTLTIPAGKRVGLVGNDELEKQALVYLIPRLLDPSTGEIRIDEHNLRWVTLDSLRDKIAMVMLHNLVFHDTVANNIGCGGETYTLPQIMEAAKLARAHQFIQKLPQGYETIIGELGHSLSPAEQYRIALARAILRDPALVVIEEPHEDLDTESKSLLDDALTRFLPGRTVIFLPHRVSTIRSCDRLFLLHKGRIEATGPHRELLTQSALYKHIHYLEFVDPSESA